MPRSAAAEIRLHAQLAHPHIIPLHAAFEDSHYVFMVTEFAAGAGWAWGLLGGVMVLAASGAEAEVATVGSFAARPALPYTLAFPPTSPLPAQAATCTKT